MVPERPLLQRGRPAPQDSTDAPREERIDNGLSIFWLGGRVRTQETARAPAQHSKYYVDRFASPPQTDARAPRSLLVYFFFLPPLPFLPFLPFLPPPAAACRCR